MPHRVFEGNRPSNMILLDATHAGGAGQACRAVRAQRLHAGRDLGHRLVRPVGRGAGQGAGADESFRNWKARPSLPSPTTARPTRSSGATAKQWDPRARPMPRGYDQPLYILPFDHRGSFETKMFGWTGALDAAQTAANRCGQTSHLRRLQAGGRRGRAEGQGRHPGRRTIRRRHPARCRRTRLHHCLPRREERPGRIRLRVRRRVRRAHRSIPSDVLQGARALQPRRRRGTQPAAGRAAQTLVRLLATRRSQPLHVRAAGAAGESATRRARRRHKRPTT